MSERNRSFHFGCERIQFATSNFATEDRDLALAGAIGGIRCLAVIKKKGVIMNLCVLAGRIVQNARVKGTDRKILRFTVETRDGHDEGETKERINQVPCVLFSPSPEMEQILTNKAKGLRVALQGRVVSWGRESNGKSNVEVAVFNRSLTFPKD